MDGMGSAIARMSKGLLRRVSVFSIIPEADVGVRVADHDDLPMIDGDNLAARTLLPVADFAAHFLLRRRERLLAAWLGRGLSFRA